MCTHTDVNSSELELIGATHDLSDHLVGLIHLFLDPLRVSVGRLLHVFISEILLIETLQKFPDSNSINKGFLTH